MFTLCHSDTVSGTTILEDGTKVYWTEGFSEATIVHPKGKIERVSAHSDHPILGKLHVIGAGREMTTAEEVEWMVARAMNY